MLASATPAFICVYLKFSAIPLPPQTAYGPIHAELTHIRPHRLLYLHLWSNRAKSFFSYP